MKTVTVNTILAKLSREIRGSELHETDIIEMIGEALEFMRVSAIQEQAVAFFTVSDYEAFLPNNFHAILQIAKARGSLGSNEVLTYFSSVRTQTVEDIVYNEEGVADSVLTPSYSLLYTKWLGTTFYTSYFSPVRLSNNVFFNSIVCKEKKDIPYSTNADEYTIVDDRLRFSFKEGVVALAYLRNLLDKKTGYPLIPDNISYITGITYYVKWKIAESMQFNRREGMDGLTSDLERKWLKYCGQGKNYMKMPKTENDMEFLIEQTHQLLPKTQYGYFGNINR